MSLPQPASFKTSLQDSISIPLTNQFILLSINSFFSLFTIPFLFPDQTTLIFIGNKEKKCSVFYIRYGINSVGVSCVHSQNFEQFLQRPCVSTSCADSMPFYPDLDTLAFYKLARILEVVIHNLDNADELLHQSFR